VKSLINKQLDCYCPTVTVPFWTVTVWPLLIFLTISGVIELGFKWNLWRWKGKIWGYRFYVLSRTQFFLQDSQNRSLTNTWTVTVQLLQSRFWTVTVWPLIGFLIICGVIELRFKWNLWRWKGKTWGYKFYIWEEPSSASKIEKSLINKHLDSYCPTVNVPFWTLTVWPLIRFLIICGVIELRFWHWKGKTWGYKLYVLRRTQFCL
jgi:hypothetical protein